MISVKTFVCAILTLGAVKYSEYRAYWHRILLKAEYSLIDDSKCRVWGVLFRMQALRASNKNVYKNWSALSSGDV